MASVSCRTERRGATLVEALVALAAGALLLGIAYGAVSAGSRLQARAGSKLASAEDAELVFRKLRRDLWAAVELPRVEGDTLTIATAASASITWTFKKGEGVERRDGHDRARHMVGVLEGFELTAGTGRAPLVLALSARGTQDTDPAQYRETFHPRGVECDPEWNPIR